MVDQLSKGRVDFGTGRSAPYEQMGMGIDPRDTRDMWEESLSMVPKIWEKGLFSWEGKFWRVPPREVLPKPYQRPHPPIWVAAMQSSTYQLAADKGIGVMALGVSAPSVLAPHVKTYHENVRQAKPVGAFINDQWLSSTVAYCDEDNKAGRELAAKSLKTFFGPDRPYLKDQVNVYERLIEQWGGVPDHLQANFARYLKNDGLNTGDAPEVDLSGGSGAIAQAIWNQLDADTLAERGVIVAGDPESCLNAIRVHESIGVDQLQFLMATETIPHEKVMTSIELFGKYVIPELSRLSQAPAIAVGLHYSGEAMSISMDGLCLVCDYLRSARALVTHAGGKGTSQHAQAFWEIPIRANYSSPRSQQVLDAYRERQYRTYVAWGQSGRYRRKTARATMRRAARSAVHHRDPR